MIMPALVRSTVVLSLALCCSCWAADAKPPVPSAQAISDYVLEIEGRKVPIALDKATTVQVGGKPVQVKLTQKPTKRFSESGMSFDYPSSYVLSKLPAEAEGLNTWKFQGTESALVVSQYTELNDPAAVLAAVIASLKSTFEGGAAKEEACTMRTPDRKLSGTSLSGRIALQDVVIRLYSFSDGASAWTVIMQENSSASSDTQRDAMLRSLEATLKIADAKSGKKSK
jgi:hypothetical protein